jgi:hypothetical protein
MGVEKQEETNARAQAISIEVISAASRGHKGL